MLTPELIEEWTKSADHIIVTPVEGEDIFIDRSDFEAFVERNDMREGCDHDESYKVSWEQYYEVNDPTLDILAFIEVRRLGNKASSLIHDLLTREL